MGTLWQDVKYGTRMLASRPGFTLVTVLTLALGIGANTAIFSAVHAVLLQPLPFAEPDRLALLCEQNFPRDVPCNVINSGNFMRWKERATSFEQMSAYAVWPMNVTGLGEPERIPVGLASQDLFATLGVRMRLGRPFTADDWAPDAESVVLLSHGYWQQRFGGSPDALGQVMSVNGTRSVVVGVLPPDFEVPPQPPPVLETLQGSLWVPLALGERHYNAGGRWMLALARLREGSSLEQARVEMAAIGQHLAEERPDFNQGWGVNVVPLREQFVGGARPALLVLLGAVAFVLLIACANVANLLLARGAARQRELAIRSALGAGRPRLLRQLLTESVLLALLGGIVGVLLAVWGVEVLPLLAGESFPRLAAVSLNTPVLAFLLGISLLTGIVFGLAPALQSARVRVNESLKEGGRGAAGGRGATRLRDALVVTEVALALVLLVGAGLLVRSFDRLLGVDTGFDLENLLTLQTSLPGSRYRGDAQKIQFYRQALERISGLPGVESAGAISWLPLGGQGSVTSFRAEGQPELPAGEKPAAEVRVVTEDLFRTLRIPLLRGRTFTARDTAEAPKVVVIDDSLARAYWPDGEAVGKRIYMDWDEVIEAEIVGVVGDVRLRTLEARPRYTLYWPQAQLTSGSMSILVRTAAAPAALIAFVRREIAALDPELPVAEVQPMNAVMAESVRGRRAVLVLVGFFAATAMLLAAVGLYGVIAYSVTQRVREIGVRVALGAQRADILRMVLGRGMLLALAGVAAGLAGAYWLSRSLASLLFEVEPTDLVTFLTVPVFLALVTLVACYVPARRATKVDPLVALRYE